MVLLIVTSLVGLALLFTGYPLFRFLVVLTGVVAGLTYGPEFLGFLTGQPPQPLFALLTAAAAALVLALVAWLLPGLVAFIFGFYVGFGVGYAAIDNVFIALGAGLVFALLAPALGRAAVIVFTALAGSWLLVTVFLQVSGSERLPVGDIAAAPLAWAVLVVVALLGMIVQFRSWSRARGSAW